MARNLGVVEFADGHRLYLIVDGTVDMALRPLFDSSDAAWAWYADGKQLDFPEPAGASEHEEPVTVIRDLAFADDPHRRDLFRFESLASRAGRWLTGPCSEEEVDLEARADRFEGWGG